MTFGEAVLRQIINGLVLGSFYALIALGYSMVYGIIRMINFAHGDVYMVGSSAKKVHRFVELARKGLEG